MTIGSKTINLSEGWKILAVVAMLIGLYYGLIGRVGSLESWRSEASITMAEDRLRLARIERSSVSAEINSRISLCLQVEPDPVERGRCLSRASEVLSQPR